MKVDIRPMELVAIITSRSDGNKVIDTLNANNFLLHNATIGRGTAPDSLSACFGVGESEKAVIFVITSDEHVSPLLNILEAEIGIGRKPNKGIAFSVPINSVANLKVLKFIKGLN